MPETLIFFVGVYFVRRLDPQRWQTGGFTKTVSKSVFDPTGLPRFFRRLEKFITCTPFKRSLLLSVVFAVPAEFVSFPFLPLHPSRL